MPSKKEVAVLLFKLSDVKGPDADEVATGFGLLKEASRECVEELGNVPTKTWVEDVTVEEAAVLLVWLSGLEDTAADEKACVF